MEDIIALGMGAFCALLITFAILIGVPVLIGTFILLVWYFVYRLINR